MDAYTAWVASLVGAYIVAMFALAYWIGKRWIQDERHFMIGAREFGRVLTVTGNTAILISGGFLPAVVMFGYLFGFGGLWFYAGWGAGALVTLLTWLVFWRINGGYTPAEWFEARYGKSGRLAGIAIILFASLAIIAWQFVGAGATLAGALGITYRSAVILVGIVVVFYVMFAGLWGVTVTDLIQWVWMIAVVFVLLPVYLTVRHGLPSPEALPEGFTSLPFGAAPVWQFTMPSVLSFIILNVFLLQLMVYWTRAASTRSHRITPTAWAWSIAIAFVLGVIGSTLGMFARMLITAELEDPVAAFGELLRLVPVPLAAAAMAGLLAATMSTTDTYLLGGVNTIIRDVAQYIYRIRDSARLLKLARQTTLVYGVLCVGFAVLWPHGLETLFAFGTASAAPLTIMYLDSWAIKKGNGAGAVAAVASTIVVVLYWNVITNLFETTVDTLYVAPPIALVVFYAVSLLTGGYRPGPAADSERLTAVQGRLLASLQAGYQTLADLTDYLTGVGELEDERIDCGRIYKDLEGLRRAGLVRTEADRFNRQLRYRLTEQGTREAAAFQTPEASRALAAHEVDAEALRLLQVAASNPGQPITELAEPSDISPKSVGAVAHRLVDAGLAVQHGLIRYQLRPTEKGRSVADRGPVREDV